MCEQKRKLVSIQWIHAKHEIIRLEKWGTWCFCTWQTGIRSLDFTLNKLETYCRAVRTTGANGLILCLKTHFSYCVENGTQRGQGRQWCGNPDGTLACANRGVYKKWLGLEYVIMIEPTTFLNTWCISKGKESKMTLKFLPEPLERWSCHQQWWEVTERSDLEQLEVQLYWVYNVHKNSWLYEFILRKKPGIQRKKTLVIVKSQYQMRSTGMSTETRTLDWAFWKSHFRKI